MKKKCEARKDIYSQALEQETSTEVKVSRNKTRNSRT